MMGGDPQMESFKQGQLLRIFVEERRRRGDKPVHAAIVEFLRAKGIAGVTIFRGIEGFGSDRELRLVGALSWHPDLPILIEVVDDGETIAGVLPELERIIGEGLITLESVDYVRLPL